MNTTATKHVGKKKSAVPLGVSIVAVLAILGFFIVPRLGGNSRARNLSQAQPTIVQSVTSPGSQKNPAAGSINTETANQESQQGEQPATCASTRVEGNNVILDYFGWSKNLPGLYDCIWQVMGYTRDDASNPKGAFVCVYLETIRKTGIESKWVDKPKKAMTIQIPLDIVNNCGGIH